MSVTALFPLFWSGVWEGTHFSSIPRPSWMAGIYTAPSGFFQLAQNLTIFPLHKHGFFSLYYFSQHQHHPHNCAIVQLEDILGPSSPSPSIPNRPCNFMYIIQIHPLLPTFPSSPLTKSLPPPPWISPVAPNCSHAVWPPSHLFPTGQLVCCQIYGLFLPSLLQPGQGLPVALNGAVIAAW